MAGTDKRLKHAIPHKTGTGKCLGRMCEEEGQCMELSEYWSRTEGNEILFN